MVYVIIHPITNKPIQFSEFPQENYQVIVTKTDEQGNFSKEDFTALCVGPIPYDSELLNKTYDPNTNSFSA